MNRILAFWGGCFFFRLNAPYVKIVAQLFRKSTLGLRIAVGCLVGALIVPVTTQVDAYACAQAIDLSHTYKAKASKPVMA